MRRILITGAGGFIGSRLAHELPSARAVPHGAWHEQGLLDGIDVVVHAGRDPRLGTAAWRLEEDVELRLAERIARSHARLISLGTRKVYAPSVQPLDERAPVGPTDRYGEQKLALERALAERLGERVTRLRIANVFGCELGRTSFMGRLLGSLVTRGEVLLDIARSTRRDFLPVGHAARALATLAADPPGGVVNLGSGLGTAVGAIADAAIAGFGGGSIHVLAEQERDAFTLEVGRLRGLGCRTCTAADIEDAAFAAGQALRG